MNAQRTVAAAAGRSADSIFKVRIPNRDAGTIVAAEIKVCLQKRTFSLLFFVISRRLSTAETIELAAMPIMRAYTPAKRGKNQTQESVTAAPMKK